MSTARNELTTAKPVDWSSRSILLAYVLAVGAQVPMLLFYFSQLWKRPHYQFFPIALIMVAAFAWIRWPRHHVQPFFASTFSSVLFGIGLGFGVLGTLFAEPWLAAASAVFLLTSLLARTRDGEFPDRSLIALALPLFVILSLPRNLDFWLITRLQLVSANLSSWYLDLLGFMHYSPGTTLNFPDKSYEVERACSGVQSFFTLMFCATFVIVAFRRSFFRGLFLLVSAVFWAVLMNSVRILVIPIADSMFGVDLKEGLPHELLGYAVMILAFLMLLSTDQLLEFLLGRQTIDDDAPQRRLFRGRRASGPGVESRQRPPVGDVARRALVGSGVLMVLLGCFQVFDVIQSMNQPRLRVRFFDNSAVVDVEPDCMPRILESRDDNRPYRWTLLGHQRSDRTAGSDLGQRSDLWAYGSPDRMSVNVSLDQPFPGWHELTTCYRNLGWEFASLRRVLSEPLDLGNGETVDWTFVEVELKHPVHLERAFLLFCFIDANGYPYEAPVVWDQLSSFVERVKNRLSFRIRSNLFRGEAYQLQMFTTFTEPVSEEQKAELRSQFFEARKLLREALIRYRDADLSGDLS